jgi:hypothetical protein
MRVLHLAQSDGGGGAHKAAFRVHRGQGQLQNFSSANVVLMNIMDLHRRVKPAKQTPLRALPTPTDRL